MKEMLTRQLPPPSANGLRFSSRKVPPAEGPVQELLDASLLLAEDWEQLPPEVRDDILGTRPRESLLGRLVEHGLLTEYQAARLDSGTTFGLILGNYRVL